MDKKTQELREMGFSDKQIAEVAKATEGLTEEVGSWEKRGVWSDEEIENRRQELAARRQP